MSFFKARSVFLDVIGVMTIVEEIWCKIIYSIYSFMFQGNMFMDNSKNNC